MKVFKSEPILKYAHLKAKDQKEFFDLVSDYFYDRADDYRGCHTIFLFSVMDGIFEVTKKFSFDSFEKFEKFRRSLDERGCYFDLSTVDGELHFNFEGKKLTSFENFDADYGTLDDYVERVTKATSSDKISFCDMMISRALEQQTAATQSKKRKLAS